MAHTGTDVDDRPLLSYEFEERFELGPELGRGGMGRVYRGVERSTGRALAVKFFSGSLFDDHALRRGFQQEARILAQIGRTAPEYVASVVGCGEEAGQPWIAFEFVEGRTLRQTLDEGSPATLGAVLDVAGRICRGLTVFHQHQVVHMDLKPANVMVTSAGRVVIIDLGVALTLAQRKDMSADGLILGTPVYMSPEQCGEGAITYRSDLYSLGVVFYEMLVGTPPFWGATLDVVSAHLRTPPVLPSARGVALSPGVEDLLMELLAKTPEERPSSAVAVRTRLLDLGRSADLSLPVGRAARRRQTPEARQAQSTVRVEPRPADGGAATPRVPTSPGLAPAERSPKAPPPASHRRHPTAASSSRRSWRLVTAVLLAWAVVATAALVVLAFR